MQSMNAGQKNTRFVSAIAQEQVNRAAIGFDESLSVPIFVNMTVQLTTRRRRSAAALWTAGTATVLLGLGATSGTFASFTAAITNNNNTAESAYLQMIETGNYGAKDVCDSATSDLGYNQANCKTINKYGFDQIGAMKPGDGIKTPISIQNKGTMAATSFTVSFDECNETVVGPIPGGASLCDELLVTLHGPNGMVFDHVPPVKLVGQTFDLAAYASAMPVAPGQTDDFTFVVELPSSATSQGHQISQNITWTYQA